MTQTEDVRVPLVMIAGHDLRSMLAFIVATFPECFDVRGEGPLVVAAGSTALARERDGLPHLIVERLRTRRRVRLIAPPRIGLAGWLGARVQGDEWTAVDLSARSDRLDRVWMPQSLAAAEEIVLVNAVGTRRRREPVAIGVWSLFARPMQRFGARFDDLRHSLAVDIALAISPRLILLTGTIASHRVVVATTDIVAAELAGISLGRFDGESADEGLGPWEDPIVQRASELGLGVRLPAEISLLTRWAGNASAMSADHFWQFCERLRSDLGLPLET